jgi:hypothetical protein
MLRKCLSVLVCDSKELIASEILSADALSPEVTWDATYHEQP